MSDEDKRLDDEMRHSGDLAAAMRFVLSELDRPMTDEQRRKLADFVRGTLRRLGEIT